MGPVNYQVMPDMRPEEFEMLKADIAARDIQVPIDVDEHGNILDGYHRDRAWRELGKNEPPPTVVRAGLTENEKRAFARKNNILRRHLSREQVRALIEQQIKETPDWADRRAARELGVDHKTVGAARERLVATGEIPQLDKMVGGDGKKRFGTGPRQKAQEKRRKRRQRFGSMGRNVHGPWLRDLGRRSGVAERCQGGAVRCGYTSKQYHVP